MRLEVDGQTVATYVAQPVVDPLRGPRPYLHPVRTLGGTVVTDAAPEDHPHHLGVSVAMQDVNGVNLWGGRTYVRDRGYQWRDDHARIEHAGYGDVTPARIEARLRWCAPNGETLLEEARTMAAEPVGDGAWALRISYALTNPNREPVRLGSPGTNGRPGNAGYGGLFWRAAPGRPRIFTAESDDEAKVNGSTAPWVALQGAQYTLVLAGLGEGDTWFVRAAEYPGVCAALAFDRVRVIEPGGCLRRDHAVVIADGALSASVAAALIGAAGDAGTTSVSAAD